jgi:fused signal recognition particle receptor
VGAVEIAILLVVLLAVVVGGGVAAFMHRSRLQQRVQPPTTLPRPAPRVARPEAADVAEPAAAPAEPATVEAATVEELVVERRPSFRERLAKARGAFTGYLGGILGRSAIDDETWEEVEAALLRADVGLPTTTRLVDSLRADVKDGTIADPSQLVEALKAKMKGELAGAERGLAVQGDPAVWLFVGVNGVGKTTTIGKLARREVTGGRTVVLAAGDTFRAAAAEQLEMWAKRSDAAIVRGAEGADPSSVVFDAVEHAAAKGAPLVLADTAGRLHTKSNLMEELRKVRRVAEKGAGTVSEVLLVIDATTGQNGLVQAKEFTDAVEVTGVVLTKLDGSAKGGIVMAIQAELGIPVKLVGLGEGVDDLVAFDPDQFVDALFA